MSPTGSAELTYANLRTPSWTPAPDTTAGRVSRALITSVLVGILLPLVIGVIGIDWAWIA